jgi:hypothetical protein
MEENKEKAERKKRRYFVRREIKTGSEIRGIAYKENNFARRQQ